MNYKRLGVACLSRSRDIKPGTSKEEFQGIYWHPILNAVYSVHAPVSTRDNFYHLQTDIQYVALSCYIEYSKMSGLRDCPRGFIIARWATEYYRIFTRLGNEIFY